MAKLRLKLLRIYLVHNVLLLSDLSTVILRELKSPFDFAPAQHSLLRPALLSTAVLVILHAQAHYQLAITLTLPDLLTQMNQLVIQQRCITNTLTACTFSNKRSSYHK